MVAEAEVEAVVEAFSAAAVVPEEARADWLDSSPEFFEVAILILPVWLADLIVF